MFRVNSVIKRLKSTINGIHSLTAVLLNPLELLSKQGKYTFTLSTICWPQINFLLIIRCESWHDPHTCLFIIKLHAVAFFLSLAQIQYLKINNCPNTRFLLPVFVQHSNKQHITCSLSFTGFGSYVLLSVPCFQALFWTKVAAYVFWRYEYDITLI